MLEFQASAVGLVDQVLGLALEKCWALALASDAQGSGLGLAQGQGLGATAGGGASGVTGVVGEAAHVEGERLALQRQTLVFLSHVATQQCDAALFSDRNRGRYLETIFNQVIVIHIYMDEQQTPTNTHHQLTCIKNDDIFAITKN